MSKSSVCIKNAVFFSKKYSELCILLSGIIFYNFIRTILDPTPVSVGSRSDDSGIQLKESMPAASAVWVALSAKSIVFGFACFPSPRARPKWTPCSDQPIPTTGWRSSKDPGIPFDGSRCSRPGLCGRRRLPAGCNRAFSIGGTTIVRGVRMNGCASYWSTSIRRRIHTCIGF